MGTSTIADNASTDGTLQVARRLMYELPGVGAMHLRAKGRGRALGTAWSVTALVDLRGIMRLLWGPRSARGNRTLPSPRRPMLAP